MYKQNYFNKTDKFEYIKNHETYWTLNSWNGLYSIANAEFRVAQENCKCIVERDFELVKQFDKLCAEIRNYVIYLIHNAKIEGKERIVTQKYTEIVQKVGA